MALFQKRQCCKDTLKHLRRRACPSDGFREVYAHRRERRRWPNQAEFAPFARFPVASPCWRSEGQVKANISKVIKGKGHGGGMSLLDIFFL